MAAKWIVIKTMPRAEYLAADELARDGFEVFLPCVKSIDSRSGHSDTPIFPGYLFLNYDPDTNGWPTFRTIHRVLGLIIFGEEVPWLSDEMVTDLKHRIEAINQGQETWHQFLPGERVEIHSKTMRTQGNIVDAKPSRQGRVKLLIDFMGRQVSAQLPWDILRPLANQPKSNTTPRRTRGKGRWIHGHSPRVGASK